jgi:uncharacterized protein (TIGR03067 family)
MTRLALALIALAGLTAFAPAPFPRQRRIDTSVSLEVLQGKWKVVKIEEVTGPGGRVRRTTLAAEAIRFDRTHWTLLQSGDQEYVKNVFRLDTGRRPAAIDIYDRDRSRLDSGVPPIHVGLIRRAGDTVEILYYSAAPAERPSSFENPPVGWWLLTLKRVR